MSSARQRTIQQKNRDLRKKLFPQVTDDELWLRQSKVGFATIPRAFPILMVLMDELSPNLPVSTTFLALWCRAWDDPMATIGNQLYELAAEAGFSGERRLNTLKRRMAKLQTLGLVKFAEGTAGDYHFALVMTHIWRFKSSRRKFPDSIGTHFWQE